jgi:hypothetical protein
MIWLMIEAITVPSVQATSTSSGLMTIEQNKKRGYAAGRLVWQLAFGLDWRVIKGFGGLLFLLDCTQTAQECASYLEQRTIGNDGHENKIRFWTF